MIPKILHFIWLGKYEPKTIRFTIDTFKKVNPDFEINFIREEDARNPQNEDVKEVYKLINSNEDNKYKRIFLDHGDCVFKSEVCFLTKFSDAIRFYLLNKYGGIYLDCDTFPVKPFDDKILSYDMFRTGRMISSRLSGDFSFVGHNPSCGYNSLDFMWLYKKKVSDKIRIINMDTFMPVKRPSEWVKLEMKYLNLTLEYGKDFYRFDNNIDDNYVNFYNRDFKQTGHWWGEYKKIENASNNNIYSIFLTAHKNKEIQETFGSSGAITSISKEVIKQGGVVYGVKFSDDFRQALYTRVTDLEGLDILKGNKYLEPNETPYMDIEQDLKGNKLVLFVGCPCRVSGVINRFKSYTNLITVSLICNSIVPQKSWDEYVTKLETKQNSKLSSVNFKYKLNFINGILKIKYRFKNGTEIISGLMEDEYMKKFILDKNFIKKCCTECLLKYPKIQGDFIIGDSWGFKNSDYGFDSDDRLNLVLCMNEKAEKYLLECNDLKTVQLKNIESAINICKKYNTMLFKHR